MKTHLLNLALFMLLPIVAVAQVYQQHSFRTVPFGGGGCVSGIITCPTQKNLIYARTDVGGAFRWVEATKSWKNLHFAAPKSGSLCVMSMAVDPSSPNRVYCFAGMDYFYYTCIMRSIDYGETWEYIDITNQFMALGNGAGKATGERLVVDPNKGNVLYCGSPMNGLFKSTDYGSTWKKITSLPATNTADNSGIAFVQFIPESSGSGYETPYICVGVSRPGDKKAPLDSVNIFLTMDGGISWSPISTMKGAGSVVPPVDLTPNQCTIAGGYLYFAYKGTGKGGVWRYDYGNEWWENVTPPNSLSLAGISIDNPLNPTLITVSTNHGGLGQNWKAGVATTWGDDLYRGTIDVNGKITWNSKRMIDGGTAIYDPKAFFPNSSMHWTFDVEIDPFNKNRVFVTSGIGVFTSDNFTQTPSLWYQNVRNLEETITMDITSKPGGEFLLALGDASGATYADPTKYGIRFNPHQAITSSVDYLPSLPTLYRVGSERVANGVTSSIMYSNDKGNIWTGVPVDKIPFNPAMPATLTSKDAKATYGRMAVSADGKIIVWSPQYWKINDVKYFGTFYTADKGASWYEMPGGLTSAESYVVSDKVNPNVFYICTGASLIVYTWNGSGFTYKSIAMPATMNRIIKVNPLVEGEFLTFNNSGLYLHKSKGEQITKIANINYCNGAAWGKSAPDRSNPTIFAFAKYGSDAVARVYRSDDETKTWVRITDDKSLFGGALGRGVLGGDMNKYGRVFISNGGIGLIYADIDNSVYAKSLSVSGQNSQTTVGLNGKLQMNALFNPTNTTTQKVAWEIDDASLATIDSFGVVTGKKNGIVTVTATALDGTGIFGLCKITVSDKINSAVSVVQSNPLARVYPNPFTENATLETTNQLTYRIVTLNGVLLQSGQINGTTHTGSALPNGIYLLELKNKQTTEKQIIKLIKNK